MLSPAHSSNSSGTNSSSSNNSSSSANSSSSNRGLEPRTVADHLANLGRALDHEFYMENPGRDDVFYHAGFFVGPNNKRRLVFYVAHGPLATAWRLTRVDYTMPADTISAVLLFGGDGESVLPPVGPNMTQIDIPAGQTAAGFVAAAIAATAGLPPAERLASWDAEITRVEGVRDNPAAAPALRQGATNIVRYWQQMMRDVSAVVFARVQRPGVPALASPPPPPPSPAGPPGPATPVSTASSERRRRSQRRRNAAAAATNRNRTTRRSTSDPANALGYYVNAVTGKRMRRRRPHSDPQ